MNATTPLPPEDRGEDIEALIETLHRTGQRLEQLTGGEVDAVANRSGETILLRHAQDRMRLNEATRQIAILNALPASIALLDRLGTILSVNDSWQRFGYANAASHAGHGVGVNYLTVCDEARGDEAAEAWQAAAGLRAVLDGKVGFYSLEYPCHSLAEQRWFLMTVTPLANYTSQGAVVMHLNITASKLAEKALQESEGAFRTLAESMPQMVWITRPDGWNTYLNTHWMNYTGLTLAQSLGQGWITPFHPDDQQPAWDAWHEAVRTNGIYSIESRLRRADGIYRWWLIRGVSQPGADGKPLKWFGTCTDIHDLKLAGLEIARANGELRESERRFSDLLGNVELISVMLDHEARIIYCNDFLLRLTGWEREEIMGKIWRDLFVPHDQRDLAGGVFPKRLEIQPEALHSEYDIVTRSGERRKIRWSNTVLRSHTGEVTGKASIGDDITDRRNAESRIAQLNRVLLVLSSINSLIVRVHDRDELFSEACNIAVDAGGFRMAMLVIVDPVTMLPVSVTSAGKNEKLIASIKNALSTSEGMHNSLVGRAIRENKAVISNDAATDPALLFASQYAEANVRSLIVLPLLKSGSSLGILALYASEADFFHDEAELKLLTELAGDIAFAVDHLDKRAQLDYLAYYDVLTGLANRSLFLERVAQHLGGAVRDGHKLALFLIDLERFKNVNDSLGRPAGDALLKQVAEWLTQFIGDASLVARFGADDFAVVVPEVKDGAHMVQLVEKWAAAFLEHPFQLSGAMFRIAAQAGVALFPDDGADAENLFRNAESALKRAKASGERYLFYNQTMTAAMAGRLTLESQLRQALDHEEFVLHYQPKINLASGKLTSAEALLRWNNPRTGLVPPGRFIPILEESGLILEVGRWALRKAIADYLRWRAAGLPAVRIAVNVSPLQLRHREFVAEIEKIAGIDPHAAAGLELEITESLIMADVKHSIASLEAIRAMNITVAIDDFGTGFSSLSYLAKLPVDTLKIDRSFVIEMTLSPDGLALVSTIINLAHSLRLKVVAEGVETDEQSRLLRLLGCDEMQGFLFSKPVPCEDFETRFLT